MLRQQRGRAGADATDHPPPQHLDALLRQGLFKQIGHQLRRFPHAHPLPALLARCERAGELQQVGAVLAGDAVAVAGATDGAVAQLHVVGGRAHHHAHWLAERDIWLFENDTWGELCFSDSPARYRDFADPDKLVVFSTFDKIIGGEAPYGYVLCRQQAAQLHRLFMQRGFRLSPIRQKAIARLHSSRRIDQHLTTLRALLRKRMQQLQTLLEEHGNGQWQVVAPQGGASFWLKAVRPIDMQRVFERLLTERIVVAPGEIFSQQGAWKQYLRLSYSLDWDKDIGHAVQRLAQAITEENRVYSP